MGITLRIDVKLQFRRNSGLFLKKSFAGICGLCHTICGINGTRLRVFGSQIHSHSFDWGRILLFNLVFSLFFLPYINIKESMASAILEISCYL